MTTYTKDGREMAKPSEYSDRDGRNKDEPNVHEGSGSKSGRDNCQYTYDVSCTRPKEGSNVTGGRDSKESRRPSGSDSPGFVGGPAPSGGPSQAKSGAQVTSSPSHHGAAGL